MVVPKIVTVIMGMRHQTKDLEWYMSRLYELIRELGMTYINEVVHEFPNGGLSINMLIAESHIALHTWPEYDFVHVEVSSCVDVAPEYVSNTIMKLFDFEDSDVLYEKRIVTGG